MPVTYPHAASGAPVLAPARGGYPAGVADQIILQKLDGSDEADRILDEFERRTGLQSDARDEGRAYELHGEDHRTRIVQTLTEIAPGWTDHLGFKLPG
jgi:hypothetical protein